MEYAPIVGAGLAIAAVAALLNAFFKLLDWERRRTLERFEHPELTEAWLRVAQRRSTERKRLAHR